MKENKGRHSDRFIDIDTDKRKKMFIISDGRDAKKKECD